jgi:CheY-like chemotaxis protein
MDLKMPKMNGSEAAKKIKEYNPDQIIIAQTAYARPEEKLKYFDENFDEYISKPINPNDLLRVLEKFL